MLRTRSSACNDFKNSCAGRLWLDEERFVRFNIQPISMRIVIEDLERPQVDNRQTRLMVGNGLYHCGRVDLSTQETRILFRLWARIYVLCVKDNVDNKNSKEDNADAVVAAKTMDDIVDKENADAVAALTITSLPPLVVDLLPKTKIMIEQAGDRPQAIYNVESCASLVIRWKTTNGATSFSSLSIVRRRYCSDSGTAKETAGVSITSKAELDKLSQIVVQLNEMDRVLFPGRALVEI